MGVNSNAGRVRTFFSFGARCTSVRAAWPEALLKPQKLHTTASLGMGAAQPGHGSGASASREANALPSSAGGATGAGRGRASAGAADAGLDAGALSLRARRLSRHPWQMYRPCASLLRGLPEQSWLHLRQILAAALMFGIARLLTH